AAGFFFNLLPHADGRSSFAGRLAFLDEHDSIYREVLSALALVHSYLKAVLDPPDEILPLIRRTGELGDDLRFVMESDDTTYVYWTERRGRGCFLQATPIDVSKTLSEHLFDELETVVLASATLAVGGTFEFVKKRLGLESARTLIVPGAFDYQKQSLLY